MERCIHKHLYNYVVSHQLLTPFQSGFIQGDSTTYQLLHTYHTLCEAVDNGKEVRAVFCDISKAFDRVWHKGLLHKLRGIGCSEQVLKWFTSYLSGRRQPVVLNGQTSDWAPVEAGVPQGSTLVSHLYQRYCPTHWMFHSSVRRRHQFVYFSRMPRSSCKNSKCRFTCYFRLGRRLACWIPRKEDHGYDTF